MPNHLLSPEGDLENLFVSEYFLIDQWVGDTLWAWGESSSFDTDNQETIHQPVDPLRSQHSQEEPTGNKFRVELQHIQQQSKLMELYGLGVVILMDNSEPIIQSIDPLQSQHLQEEPTGNKFLAVFIILQQSKLMEPYGLGVGIFLDSWETIQAHLD